MGEVKPPERPLATARDRLAELRAEILSHIAIVNNLRVKPIKVPTQMLGTNGQVVVKEKKNPDHDAFMEIKRSAWRIQTLLEAQLRAEENRLRLSIGLEENRHVPKLDEVERLRRRLVAQRPKPMTAEERAKLFPKGESWRTWRPGIGPGTFRKRKKRKA